MPYFPWHPPTFLLSLNHTLYHILIQPIFESYFQSAYHWIMFSFSPSLNHIFTQLILESYFHSANCLIYFHCTYLYEFTQPILASYFHSVDPWITFFWWICNQKKETLKLVSEQQKLVLFLIFVEPFPNSKTLPPYNRLYVRGKAR